jgi:hypothetical protein
MAEADSDTLIVSKSGSPLYGRTDGVGVLPDAAGDTTTSDGLVAIANGAVCRSLEPSMLCEIFEDFMGIFIIPDADSLDLAQGPWVSQTTASAAPARVADADNGVIKLVLDNGNEVGDSTVYWGDEQNIDSDQEPFMICRVKTSTTPAAADSISWGFASGYNALRDSVANNAWFSLEGASLALKAESDDASTDTDGKALTTTDGTAVTLTADTYYEFMISMSSLHGASPTDVRFFYRPTLGGAWQRLISGSTVFKFGADIATQPYFQIEKTSGTSTPDLFIDYVQVFWKRN